MGSMWGPLLIVLVLCIGIPVAVMMSGAVAAGLLGFFTQSAVDHDHEGSELLETNR